MRNGIKRIICVAAALMLAFSAAVIPVYGASDASVTYSASSAEVSHGQTFSVTLSLDGCSSLKSIRVRPQYDDTALELVSMEWLITGTSIASSDGSAAVAAYSTDRTDISGEILRCSFKALDAAAVRDTDVSFDVMLKSKASGTEEEIACTVQDKTTVAITHTLGSTVGGVKTCTKCGYVSDLRVGAASVTLESDLTVNIKVRKDVFDGAGYVNPYVVATKDGEEITLTEYEIDGNYYVFALKNFAPRQMGDSYSAVVHGTRDGIDIAGAEVHTYSITAYLASQFSRAASTEKGEALKTLIADLLVYGYEHQLYNDYNVDAPVTDAISAEDLAAYATAETPTLTKITNTAYETIESPTATWKSASLTLKSSIEVNVKFAVSDIDGVTVVFKNSAGEVLDEISEFTFETDRYVAKFTKLRGSQLSEPLYITVCKDGTAISNTLLYSVESYAAQNKSSSTVGALCVAMMKYGNSAVAYFSL